jgi:hypothetical protein
MVTVCRCGNHDVAFPLWSYGRGVLAAVLLVSKASAMVLAPSTALLMLAHPHQWSVHHDDVRTRPRKRRPLYTYLSWSWASLIPCVSHRLTDATATMTSLMASMMLCMLQTSAEFH